MKSSKVENEEILLSLDLIKNQTKEKYMRILYGISNNVENNYRVHHIKKRNGKIRTIYEPTALLKHIQRRILSNILEKREISVYAKAYKKGISIQENALPHTGKNLILKLDIQDFFNNISFYNIYSSCFENLPKNIGLLLTYLCTYYDFLPQGAPTSAYISNLVMKNFDETVGEWCDKNDIDYTRYSDDMTFSGNFYPKTIIRFVRKELYKIGLELNDEKIHVIHRNFRQTVTGLTVNEKVQTDAEYRRQIRQELYYIKKFGLKSHLNSLGWDTSLENYLLKLSGKISYVLSITPNKEEFRRYLDSVRVLIEEINTTGMENENGIS